MLLSARNASETLPSDQVPGWVKENDAGTDIYIVLATMVVYDTLCTLDQEVKFFWRKSIGLTTILFFVNRYAGILGAILSILGNLSIWEPTFSSWIANGAINYILTIRVLALYRNEWRLATLLFTLFFLKIVSKLVLGVLVDTEEGSLVVALADNQTSCALYGLANGGIVYGAAAITIVYLTFLLGLTLGKAFQTWRTGGRRLSRLVLVLVKDQVLYTVLAIASALFSVAKFKIASVSWILTCVFSALGSPTLLCIIGSHMFFNLKEAAEQGVGFCLGSDQTYQISGTLLAKLNGEERSINGMTISTVTAV